MSKWRQLIVAWPEETMERRVSQCISMLYIHGIISQTERNNARKRLDKALSKPEPVEPIA